MKIFMLTLIVIFSSSIIANASGPKYYTSFNKAYTNMIVGDQDKCQAEANYMAANNITSHVWGTIGTFEGIGYGSGPNCNTCTPSNNMRLTGDASAQGRNGKWYRVRSWR